MDEVLCPPSFRFLSSNFEGLHVCQLQVSEATIEAGYTAAQFHPDGLILGTGTKDSMVRIWEVRQQKVRHFQKASTPCLATASRYAIWGKPHHSFSEALLSTHMVYPLASVSARKDESRLFSERALARRVDIAWGWLSSLGRSLSQWVFSCCRMWPS